MKHNARRELSNHEGCHMDAHETSFNHRECWVCVCVRWGGDGVGSCVCVGGACWVWAVVCVWGGVGLLNGKDYYKTLKCVCVCVGCVCVRWGGVAVCVKCQQTRQPAQPAQNSQPTSRLASQPASQPSQLASQLASQPAQQALQALQAQPWNALSATS